MELTRWDYFIIALVVLLVFVSLAVNYKLLAATWLILGLDVFKQHVYDDDYS